MRKTVIAIVLFVVGATTTIGARVAPVGALEGCSVAWGSLAKHSSRMSSAPVTNVRAGQHPCFDRLVVDVAGTAPGYDVQYVSQVTHDGSGAPVPLRGGAFLQVTVLSPAHDVNYQPTYRPANKAELVNVTGFRTFRQVAWAGTFEGTTTFGLGVRGRLPFRVSTWQSSPTSGVVIVDVAHGW